MANNEYAAFGEAFLDAYLDRGFGALPKRETDLLIFDLLCQMGQYCGKSNYELSTLLKIPESRVKTLRLASALKYRDLSPKSILAGVVARLTDNGQIPEVVNGKIEISLEDPIEHREMNHFLKGLGQHAEFTFNSEVLRVSPSALFELIIENSDDPMTQFDEVIQSAVDNREQAAALLKSADSMKTKLARFRAANLKPELVVELLVVAAPVFLKAVGA